MDNFEQIKKSLEKALGVKFKVSNTAEESFTDQEKKAFTKMVKRLEKLVANEDTIYKQSKIDISTIVEPYWEAIEEVLAFHLSDVVAGIIWWYVYDRKDTNGKIQPWEDEDGTDYIIKTPGDLYEFIINKYSL
jgi:hypothetical protein